MLGIIKCVLCVCKTGMCVGICMHTLNDSTYFTFTLSFSLPLLSFQLRPCVDHFDLALASQSTSCLPGFTFAFNPSGKLVQISFHSITSLIQAYSGFPLFYHIESKFPRLAFKAYTSLFCPSPISSISFLFSLFSSQITMLIDLHICLTYFSACSLPVNISHFSLLIHAYHFKIQLKTLSCGKSVLLTTSCSFVPCYSCLQNDVILTFIQ